MDDAALAPARFDVCVGDVTGSCRRPPFTSLHHYSPWNVDDDGRPITTGENLADTDLGVETGTTTIGQRVADKLARDGARRFVGN